MLHPIDLQNSTLQYAFSCEECECDPVILESKRNSEVSSMAVEESKQKRFKIEELNSNIELGGTNDALDAVIRNLQDRLRENKCARHTGSSDNLEAELTCMLNQMDSAVVNLEEERKTADMKVAVYRALYKHYKARLNMPIQSTNMSRTDRPTWSKHVRSGTRSYTRTGRDDIEIVEACYETYGLGFIKLHNKGNKEISLRGWKIIHKADAEKRDFKLRIRKIRARAYKTVWIKRTTHIPFINQMQFVANHITTLINNDGEEMATYCQRKSQELCSIMKDMFYNNFCNFTDIVKTHCKFELDKKKIYFGDNGEEKLDNIIESTVTSRPGKMNQ